MPLHDFRCPGCETEFEALVRTGEPPRCPQCDRSDVERLLSGFAVGSGRTARSTAGPRPAPGGGG